MGLLYCLTAHVVRCKFANTVLIVPIFRDEEKIMQRVIQVQIVAVKETAGSALYGMKDVLMSAGSLWQELVRQPEGGSLFNVSIVSLDKTPFLCGNQIPVNPDAVIGTTASPDLLILPELWLGPDEVIHQRYPELMDWIRQQHANNVAIYSACSGAIMLAESGLLNGCEATSHWGYQQLFEVQYPEVKFRPESNLVFADEAGRIVTAGGTTSWHDLALHIIARYGSPAEAMRIAKVYLLKWHGEGQLPYASLLKNLPHDDALVTSCEAKLKTIYREPDALTQILRFANIPERTIKRRFKAATGSAFIDYIQHLRIEEAKRLLETTRLPLEEVGFRVGYEDPSFFRRLFKRLTGLPANQYRRLFRPIVEKK
jgi:transcriptional regulator GlxA family with amidase domain